jgi:7-cyano-7-deazaguanine synthase
MTKAIVLASGGMDSATCLAMACMHFDEIIPVHYDYGQQTADVEKRRAELQVNHLSNIYEDTVISQLEVVDYKPVFGHFARGTASDRESFTTEDGELEEDDGRSTGYVPMRNLHLIATGAAFADIHDADAVYHGAQSGDEESYPDCRGEFMVAAGNAISRSVADGDTIDLATPLLNMTKEEVIKNGEKFGVAWEYTYSCYSETDFEDPDPCGECPACVERIEAFDGLDINDPVMNS